MALFAILGALALGIGVSKIVCQMAYQADIQRAAEVKHVLYSLADSFNGELLKYPMNSLIFE